MVFRRRSHPKNCEDVPRMGTRNETFKFQTSLTGERAHTDVSHSSARKSSTTTNVTEEDTRDKTWVQNSLNLPLIGKYSIYWQCLPHFDWILSMKQALA